MDKETYLEKKVKPIMEQLTYQVLLTRPKDPVEFMLEYLQKSAGYTSNGLTLNEKLELENLRKEIIKYRDNKETEQKKEESVISDEDDNEEELDVINEIETKQKALKGKSQRVGVSAEVYGSFNIKENFKPKVIQKTSDQINRIHSRIIQSFLFQSLEQNEVDIVINAMDEKTYHPGDVVIKQGEQGDCLYIIEKGELDCFKKFANDPEEKLVKKYAPGDSFGELALLYNSPRQATVKAVTESILWILDREVFNHIVKGAAMKKRDKYEKFLRSVDILSTADSYELSQISDALKTCTYKKGDYVIREGELGDVFYIIEQGNAIATKTLEPGKQPVQVFEYKESQYFGERALIKGEARAANIIAETDLKLISLDRNSFKRLLGPIEEILKRNIEKYNTIVLQHQNK